MRNTFDKLIGLAPFRIYALHDSVSTILAILGLVNTGNFFAAILGLVNTESGYGVCIIDSVCAFWSYFAIASPLRFPTPSSISKVLLWVIFIVQCTANLHLFC